jgi:hypothetical protein
MRSLSAIVPMRRAIFAIAMAAMTACARQAPVERYERLELPALAPIDLRLLVQPEHRRGADRYTRAAETTIETCSKWLAPFARQSLTLIDPAWHGQATEVEDAVVLEWTPSWTTDTSMAPELAVARGISRQVWRDLVDAARLPHEFIDALVEITARRAVTPLFQGVNIRPGYAFYEERYFGGFVPKFIRIRLLPEAVDPKRPEARALLALSTLDRWLGAPIFDAVVAEFVRASRGSRPTVGDFERVAGEVSGQDLKWFFEAAFTAKVFDYGVAQLDSGPEDDGSYRTTVVARRYGDGIFAGTSLPRTGPFESGRGMTVLTRFADGEQVREFWDGRDREKTFVYRSRARASSAEVDPDRTLLMDVSRTNNSRTLAPQSGTAATRWAGRWLIWLQDFLLGSAALV